MPIYSMRDEEVVVAAGNECASRHAVAASRKRVLSYPHFLSTDTHCIIYRSTRLLKANATVCITCDDGVVVASGGECLHAMLSPLPICTCHVFSNSFY